MSSGDVPLDVGREVSSSEVIGAIMLILISEPLSEFESGPELEHSSSVVSAHLVSWSFCVTRGQ